MRRIARLGLLLGCLGAVLPLALRASRLAQSKAIDRALDMLVRARRPGRRHDPLICARATHRAGRFVAAFGCLNTCLTRSLILAALLSDRGDVRLHVGFRAGPKDASIPDGHAWVTLNGINVSDLSPDGADQPFTEARVFTVSRDPEHRARST